MKSKFLVLIALTTCSAQGSAAEIEQILRSMVRPGATPPTEFEFQSKVGQGVQALSADDIRAFLPLARTALTSESPKVRDYGLQFFLSVSIRQQMDSAQLVSPYVPDLEKILKTKGDPLKRLALTVCVFLLPEIPVDLIKFFSSNLENPDNADEDTGLEAVALLQTRDPKLIHQVVTYAKTGNRPFVTAKVLHQLGLMHSDSLAGLSLIESSLESSSYSIRWEAVGAVSRYPAADRLRFLAKLNQMSVDLNEKPEIREKAKAAAGR